MILLPKKVLHVGYWNSLLAIAFFVQGAIGAVASGGVVGLVLAGVISIWIVVTR